LENPHKSEQFSFPRPQKALKKITRKELEKKNKRKASEGKQIEFSLSKIKFSKEIEFFD